MTFMVSRRKERNLNLKDFVTAIKDPYSQEIEKIKEEYETKVKEKDKLIYKLIALIHIINEFSKDNFRENNKLKISESNYKSLCKTCNMFNFCIQNHDVALENGKPISDSEMYRCYMKNLISRICYSYDDFRCSDNKYDEFNNAIFKDKKELNGSDYIAQSIDERNCYPTCITTDGEKYFKESELKYIFDFIDSFNKDSLHMDPNTLFDSLKYFLSDKKSQQHIYDTIKSLVKIAPPRYRISGYR